MIWYVFCNFWRMKHCRLSLWVEIWFHEKLNTLSSFVPNSLVQLMLANFIEMLLCDWHDWLSSMALWLISTCASVFAIIVSCSLNSLFSTLFWMQDSCLWCNLLVVYVQQSLCFVCLLTGKIKERNWKLRRFLATSGCLVELPLQFLHRKSADRTAWTHRVPCMEAEARPWERRGAQRRPMGLHYSGRPLPLWVRAWGCQYQAQAGAAVL